MASNIKKKKTKKREKKPYSITLKVRPGYMPREYQFFYKNGKPHLIIRMIPTTIQEFLVKHIGQSKKPA